MEFTEINKEYKSKPIRNISTGEVLWGVDTDLLVVYEHSTFYGRKSVSCLNVSGYKISVVQYDAVSNSVSQDDLLYIPIDKLSNADLSEAIKIVELLEKKSNTRKVGRELVIKFRQKQHENNST